MPAETAGKQTKHDAIINSIGRLGTARDGLQNLLTEITGNASPPEEATTKCSEAPRLLQFLNDTESFISTITDDLNRIRDELQEALL